MVALAAAALCAAAVLVRRYWRRRLDATARLPLANRYATPTWSHLDRVDRF